MKRSMLDILACPIDKHYPLELVEVQVDNEEEIKEGALVCSKCGRYYPIIDDIPMMLPDELRDRQRDINFLEKWKDRLPDKVLKQGNPWHL